MKYFSLNTVQVPTVQVPSIFHDNKGRQEAFTSDKYYKCIEYVCARW